MTDDTITPRTHYDPAVARALGALERLGDPEDAQATRYQLTPEQRLCGALIADAVLTLRRGRYACSSRHERDGRRDGVAEARRWIARASDQPGTFVWCCQALGWDPEAVRRLIAGPQAVAHPYGTRTGGRWNVRIGAQGA